MRLNFPLVDELGKAKQRQLFRGPASQFHALADWLSKSPAVRAFREAFDLGQRRGRTVAERRKRESRAGNRQIDRSLRIRTGQQPVNEPGGERVAAPDAVEDFEIDELDRACSLVASEANTAKVVPRC